MREHISREELNDEGKKQLVLLVKCGGLPWASVCAPSLPTKMVEMERKE